MPKGREALGSLSASAYLIQGTYVWRATGLSSGLLTVDLGGRLGSEIHRLALEEVRGGSESLSRLSELGA